MKLTRDQLKAFVKELMIEILSEGLGNVNAPAQVRPSVSPRVAEARRRTFDPNLDVPIKSRPSGLKEVIEKQAGGNPVMADILADTAMTTLQTQLSAGDSMESGGAGAARMSRQEHVGDPVELFGQSAQVRPDGSSHWADLAFMEPGKKSA